MSRIYPILFALSALSACAHAAPIAMTASPQLVQEPITDPLAECYARYMAAQDRCGETPACRYDAAVTAQACTVTSQAP